MRALSLLPVFTAMVLCVGCGGNAPMACCTAPTPNTSATTYQGTIAGTGGESGTLTLSVSGSSQPSDVRPAAVSQVSGSVRMIASAAVSLTGTFDPSSNAVSVSGGGFAFTGTLASGAFTGTYTGPNGASGGWSALSAVSGNVAAYCGTYVFGTERGVWNLEIGSTGVVAGQASSDDPPPVSLKGQVTGDALSLSTSEGGTASGTVQNGTIAGTGVNNDGGTGTFSGSTAACAR